MGPCRSANGISFADLEPYELSRLQLVSRHLQGLCLDNRLWKRHCFEGSPWYQALLNRRNSPRTPFTSADDSPIGEPIDRPDEANSTEPLVHDAAVEASRQRSQKLRDMASWDPAFPNERVSWYDEYIQREGPACINWLQAPRISDQGLEAVVEARGVALYSPYDGDDGIGTMLAVSPLDDGSVCLWDVKGTRGRQGGILAQSRPELLYMTGPSDQNGRSRFERIDSSVADRVAVDNHGHRAFFAVQSRKCPKLL